MSTPRHEDYEEYAAQFPRVVGYNTDRNTDAELQSVLVHVEYIDGATEPQMGVKFDVDSDGAATIRRVQDDNDPWSRVVEIVKIAQDAVSEVPGVETVETEWS